MTVSKLNFPSFVHLVLIASLCSCAPQNELETTLKDAPLVAPDADPNGETPTRPDWYRATGVRDTVEVGNFRVFYEDVKKKTGYGFDDPIEGQGRRQALEDVLAYYSSFILDEGVADIDIKRSINDDRESFLAFAGSLIWRRNSGFQGGLVFEHITEDRNPGSGHDGNITVNFGHPLHHGTEAPVSGTYDLRSILLHEMFHALGFSSLAIADGTSWLGDSDDEVASFMIYDSYLARLSSGEPLYGPRGEIFAGNNDMTGSDLGLAAPAVMAIYGEIPPVYAPNFYQEGSSTSHWDFPVWDRFEAADPSIMVPSIRSGAARRQLHSWELAALEDFGYRVRESGACGDGIIDSDQGELCDTAGEASNDCDTDCTRPICGDGIVNAVAGEECDDAGPSATCSATCRSIACNIAGDANGDGLVTASDALEALRIAFMLDTPSSEAARCALNVNGDEEGKITASDALIVLQMAVGVEPMQEMGDPEAFSIGPGRFASARFVEESDSSISIEICATTQLNSEFEGWQGDCVQTHGRCCVLATDADYLAQARFRLKSDITQDLSIGSIEQSALLLDTPMSFAADYHQTMAPNSANHLEAVLEVRRSGGGIEDVDCNSGPLEFEGTQVLSDFNQSGFIVWSETWTPSQAGDYCARVCGEYPLSPHHGVPSDLIESDYSNNCAVKHFSL